jgi:hypothetical protein
MPDLIRHLILKSFEAVHYEIPGQAPESIGTGGMTIAEAD